MTIYLDNNATTRPDPMVVEGVLDAMSEGFGNAASSHVVGRGAAARVRRAADQVARLLGVPSRRLVWTSGATEALNTALRAAAEGRVLVTCRTEHRAVLDVVEDLETHGHRVVWVSVADDGVLRPEAVATALGGEPGPPAIVVGAANGETGVLNDVDALTAVARARGGVVVCDATQQVGKLPISLAGVDYAAASAHKLYGPQGVGVLITPTGRQPVPLIRGGGHQRGWRSGTLNVPGIVGFGIAAEIAQGSLADEEGRQRALVGRLHALLVRDLGRVEINGGVASRLPNTLNVWVRGVPADALIVNCPEVAFSSGSACTASVPHPSHVLLAMGLGDVRAEESVRLSVGRNTTEQDIEAAAGHLVRAAQRIRGIVAPGEGC